LAFYASFREILLTTRETAFDFLTDKNIYNYSYIFLIFTYIFYHIFFEKSTINIVVAVWRYGGAQRLALRRVEA